MQPEGTQSTPVRYISYAQNGEDVVLARALPAPSGFYVDIGAWDPDRESVTRHFYERGWRGINVEPIAEFHSRFEAARPRDINVLAAISDRDGEAVIWQAPAVVSGHSTLDESVASAHVNDDQHFVPITVRTMTLASLLDKCVPPGIDIDFLKVDVEGLEDEVLRSNDWDKWRPKIVVVECITPYIAGSTHTRWEPLMLENGYMFVLFDGLNRYYVGAEHESLSTALSAPANILDPFDSEEVVSLRASLAAYDEWGRSLSERVIWLEQRLSALGTSG